MQYVPWNIQDNINLQLHYDSLHIPKATKIDDNITRQLNKLYDLYDQKLNVAAGAEVRRCEGRAGIGFY